MAYLDNKFISHIVHPIKTIFELGSRDIVDAIKLVKYFNADVYAFECNPECLELCYTNYSKLNNDIANRITIIPSAVASQDSIMTFYPFDTTKYDNIGSSSMLKIDFSKRDKHDPDFNRENPQKEIKVSGVRMDTFCKDNSINKIDLVCMDLQGYELEALKGFGKKLNDVRYLITEASINSTYDGGASFKDVKSYLESFGFVLIAHNIDGVESIPTEAAGFSEFDCLFVNKH